MGYRLADGLSYCFVDGRVAFFDRIYNRYYASTNAVAHALSRLNATGDLSPTDERALKALVDGGTLLPSATVGLAPPPLRHAPPTRELTAEDGGMRLDLGLSAFGTRVSTAATFNIWPLRMVLKRLEQRKQAHATRVLPIPSVSLAHLVHRFDRTRALLSMSDKCLPTSVALCDYLLSNGHVCDLVIGVRLRPFGAHAWVQQGDLVVGDTLDNVRPFTPIQVI